jgi:hypothetical protein
LHVRVRWDSERAISAPPRRPHIEPLCRLPLNSLPIESLSSSSYETKCTVPIVKKHSPKLIEPLNPACEFLEYLLKLLDQLIFSSHHIKPPDLPLTANNNSEKDVKDSRFFEKERMSKPSLKNKA